MRRLCGPAWRPSRVQLIRDPPRDKGPFSKFFEAPVDYSRAERLPRLRRRDARRAGARPQPGLCGNPRASSRRGGRQRAGRLPVGGEAHHSQPDRLRRALARQRLPRPGPEPAHARPQARRVRRHLLRASPIRKATRPRRACSGRRSRSPRSQRRSASPSRAPSPAPSRLGPERRQPAGGRGTVNNDLVLQRLPLPPSLLNYRSNNV